MKKKNGGKSYTSREFLQMRLFQIWLKFFLYFIETESGNWGVGNEFPWVWFVQEKKAGLH